MTDYTELKRLEAAATKGPWIRDQNSDVSVSESGDEAYWAWEVAGPVQVEGHDKQTVADADFVSAARDAIPALIEDNERLSRFEEAYNVFIEKTEWVQKTGIGSELGRHRADILRARIDQLQAENEALREGAERYLFLRDRCGLVQYKAIAGSVGPGMLPSGEKLDLTIDAAMGKAGRP